MSKQIGRTIAVGFGKETTRGTAVVPAYWIPTMSVDINEKVKNVINQSSIGVREDSIDQVITEQTMEGSIGGNIDTNTVGLLLLAALGTDTPTTVNGGTKHAFTVSQSGQLPTLSLSEKTTVGGFSYPLVAIKDFEINLELNKFLEFKTTFTGNPRATATLTPAFTQPKTFTPQTATFGYATNKAGLSSPTAVNIRKFNVKFNNNIEDDQALGSLLAVDRLSKQFSCEGSLELLWTDNTFVDLCKNSTNQAFQVVISDTAQVVGTSNASITIIIPRAEFKDVARKISNDGYIMQTINFKATYSITDSQMVEVDLFNSVSSY